MIPPNGLFDSCRLECSWPGCKDRCGDYPGRGDCGARLVGVQGHRRVM